MLRLAAAAALLPLSLGLAACGSTDESGTDPNTPDPGSGSSTAAPDETTPDTGFGVSCTYTPGGPAARTVDLPPETAAYSGDVSATVATSQGTFDITLDAAAAPCTVNSFASLATQSFYDDTPCHRLTSSPQLSVLQCGDPDGSGMGGPGYSYADEVDGLIPAGANPSEPIDYPAGTLAMANAGPSTNGSQFFMVYEDSRLPPAYTMFGTVSDEGLDVLRKVAAAGDASGAGDGPPNLPVQIERVTIN